MLGAILAGLFASLESGCPPAALVDGEVGARDRLMAELERRGVTVAPPLGCPAVRVEVRSAGAALRVAMVDSQGRFAERISASPAVAAALVESWSCAELSAPLLDMPAAVPVPASRAARRFPLSAFARVETGLDSDAGGWVGTGIGLCLWIGPLCLGPELALRGQPLAAGRGHPEVRRDAADLVLAAGLQGFRSGRLWIVPSVGVGIGWMRSESADPNRSAEPGRRRGLRAEVALAVGMPLGDRLSLEARVAAMLAPRGRGEDRPDLPELLPNDPWGLFVAGLGLRWGTP